MIKKSMSKLVIEVIITIFITIIIGSFNNISYYLNNVIIPYINSYQIFFGVMFSWLIAVASTGIILFFAVINSGKSDQYEKIFRKYEKWLMIANIAVLFYISINLASEALTNKGVPILSTTYEIAFIQISPQNAFLISLVFMTIFLLFFVAPRSEIKILPLIIIALIILIVLFFIFAKPVPKSYLFSWDEIPGNDNGRLIEYLVQNFNIEWIKAAKIIKNDDGKTIRLTNGTNFLLLKLNDEKTNVNLEIDDGRTSKFIVKTENDELNIYPESNQKNQKGHFFVSSIFGLILTIVLYLRMPEKAKGGDFNDLCLYFSIMPAPIVASLVLIGHNLVTFPNLAGHIIVGFLFISGFASLVILTAISLKNIKIGSCIWIFAAVLSLFAISAFSFLFLVLKPFFYDINTFRNTLMFSIAIIFLILQYGFSYEKLLKYRFTEWWRRVWRPMAMVISILAILVLGAIDPNKFVLWGIPVKLLGVFLALLLVVCLPWILGLITFRKTFWKNIEFRGFKPPKIPPLLPGRQGMLLIKAETGPDKLKNIVDKLDSIKGVYQTLVVMGEYDVCLIVEGVDSDDIAGKIFEIRKIEGVASTTTLTDIRESFDRVVK